MPNERGHDASRRAESHASDEVCNDILLGLKSNSVVEQWTDHFSRCSVCEERFRQLAAELEVLRSEPVPPVARRYRWTFRRRQRFTAWAAAASLVLLLVVRQVWFAPTTEADFWLPVDVGEITLRSQASEASQAFEGAIQAYQRHDAQAAIAALRLPLDDEGYDLVRQIYLASALLQGGDPQAALEVLEALQVETLPPPWRSRGLWLRYGSLKALARTDAARALLEQLADDTGPIGTRARQELQKVRP